MPRTAQKLAPLRVLVSTDVLSEGVNLQDGTLLVNYDLHWNPVRLMQRIGRVDRRMNPTIEAELVKAHPSAKASRGHDPGPQLPAAGRHRAPAARSTSACRTRCCMISKTLGIPGGKLIDEDDVLDDVKVFQAFKDEYGGDMSTARGAAAQVARSWCRPTPASRSSSSDSRTGSASAKDGDPGGLFVCRQVPVLTKKHDDDDSSEWTLDPGEFAGRCGPPDGWSEASRASTARSMPIPNTAHEAVRRSVGRCARRCASSSGASRSSYMKDDAAAAGWARPRGPSAGWRFADGHRRAS